MSPNDDEPDALALTRRWIEQVVIGLNFCPFAKRELRRNAVRLVLAESHRLRDVLPQLLAECRLLDGNPDTETTLFVLPRGFEDFLGYLELLARAETAMADHGYDGIYQLASFHPDYRFAGAGDADAGNYTNRSPYPMLHLLREASLGKAIDNYPDIDSIPRNNMEKARALGTEHFRKLLEM